MYTPVYPTLNSEDIFNSFGPRSIGLLALGEWNIREQSTINTTLCEIGPSTSPYRFLKFFTVWCAPNWNETAEGFLKRLPLDQPIVIRSVPEFSDAALAASQAWESILQSYGINVDFQMGNCATVVNGVQNPYCINVVRGLVPTFPNACAGVHADTDPTTGVINESPTMYIPHTSYSPARLKQLISHELAHLLGLDDKLCGREKSVMWTPALEGSQICPLDVTGNEAQTPTITDALPVAKTVYGPTGATRATCPAQ
jgi:hypothetical protein